MDPRAEALVRDLALVPHPEGGHYRELFRSPARVSTSDGRGERDALTAIHFLLVENGPSRWHRVRSDEAWCFGEGAPIELLVVDERFVHGRVVRLGPASKESEPVHVVPAGWWQAARTTGAYSLAACIVGPGFEFADFELLSKHQDDLERFVRRFPGWAAFA